MAQYGCVVFWFVRDACFLCADCVKGVCFRRDFLEAVQRVC